MTTEGFYILSLKWSRGREILTWWGPKNSGYTGLLEGAGVYTREQVDAKPSYYNNGDSTLAIPVASVADLQSTCVHADAAHELLRVAETLWGVKAKRPRDAKLREEIQSLIDDCRDSGAEIDTARVVESLQKMLNEEPLR